MSDEDAQIYETAAAARASGEGDIMGQLEEASGKLDGTAQSELLTSLIAVVGASGVDMSFQQAMQAAERCQARLAQEKEVYSYFSAVVNGQVELSDISTATNATDHQGRPIIARIPLAEIAAQEIPDETERAEVLKPFFAIINNYYAKRVSAWVNQTTIYMAIAAAKMPQITK